MSTRRRSRGKRPSRISRWRSEIELDDDDDEIVGPQTIEEAVHAAIFDLTDVKPEVKAEPVLVPLPPILPRGAIAMPAIPPLPPVTDAAVIVEPIAETSEALTRPIELVPTPSELTAIELAAQENLMPIVRIPPKPAPKPVRRTPTVEATPPKPKRSRMVVMSAIVAFAGLLIAIGSVIWARGEVERARSAQAEPVAVVASTANLETSSVVVPTPAREPAPVAKPVEATRAPAVSAAVARAVEAAATEPRAAGVAPRSRTETEVAVTSVPAGADVFVNGRKIGRTPLVAKVERGKETTMWFHAHGMTSDWRRIAPKDARSAVHIAMQPAQ
jgi:hypothetical protein